MKTIIITGANGNLGSATVQHFLENGYRVIAVDNKDGHLQFASGNPDFQFQSVNLLDENAVADFVANSISKWGSIEGALLLVGGFAMGNMETTKGSDIEQMFRLNFETAYFLARPLLQYFKTTGYGRLVFIGGRPSLLPEQGKDMMAYALSKSLLFKLADFINAETKGQNISASVVVPSTIDTSINRESMPNADFAAWVKPSQLAEVLEFICSDKGSAVREGVYKVYNNA